MAQVWATATIGDSRGLHARLAWQVRQAALASGCRIVLTWQGRTAEADSFAELLALGAGCGDAVGIAVDGEDAERVAAELCFLVERSEEAAALAPMAESVLAPGRASGAIYRVIPDEDTLQSRLHDATWRDRAAQALATEITSQTWDEDIRAILEASLAVLICTNVDLPEMLRSVPVEVRRDVLRRVQHYHKPRTSDSRELVIVGEYLLPADLLPPSGCRVVGACCVANGWLSHAAVYARSLGIPMIAVSSGELAALYDGQDMTIGEDLPVKAEAMPLWPGLNSNIALWLDSASPEEVRAGLARGAVGVGLVRSEFLAAQACGWQAKGLTRAISELLDAAGDRPVVLRLPQSDGLYGSITDENWLMRHPGILQMLLEVFSQTAPGHDVRLAVSRVTSQESWQAVITIVREAGLSLPVYACIESEQGLSVLSSLVPRPAGLLLGTGDLAADLAGLNRETAPIKDVFYSMDFVQAVRMLVLRAQELELPLIGCGAAAYQLPEAALLVALGMGDLAVPATGVIALRSGLAHLTPHSANALGKELLNCTSAQQIQTRVQRWLKETGAQV